MCVSMHYMNEVETSGNQGEKDDLFALLKEKASKFNFNFDKDVNAWHRIVLPFLVNHKVIAAAKQKLIKLIDKEVKSPQFIEQAISYYANRNKK